MYCLAWRKQLYSFIPPADIRRLRDLVRYRWKLTNFTTGEKNRAQNCLAVSNIRPDDVFSDDFGKAASAITAQLLEHPAEKITDVSGFRTKGMKATNEEVLAAVDGEMCGEQAEKLRLTITMFQTFFFFAPIFLHITTKKDLLPKRASPRHAKNIASAIQQGRAPDRPLSTEDTYPHRFQQVSWLARLCLPRLLAFAMAFAADSSLTVTGSLRICT